MGQVFKNYWTSVSKKPKGFKFLKTNVYEYEVNFSVAVIPGVYSEYYTETIPIHYKYVGDIGERKILAREFIKSVKEITNVELSDISTELFRRDGILVPFVEIVTVPLGQIERYLEYRDMRDRVTKINQLKNKMS